MGEIERYQANLAAMEDGEDTIRDAGGTALRKGPWMPEEDEILIEYVRNYGARDWSAIKLRGLLPRTGKSCRLRWVNKLKPDLKRCKFSAEEEQIVLDLQAQFGNKWAMIATHLTGRTDNDVKNFWSTRRKRLARLLKNMNNNETVSQQHDVVPLPQRSTHNVKNHDTVFQKQIKNLVVPQRSTHHTVFQRRRSDVPLSQRLTQNVKNHETGFRQELDFYPLPQRSTQSVRYYDTVSQQYTTISSSHGLTQMMSTIPCQHSAFPLPQRPTENMKNCTFSPLPQGVSEMMENHVESTDYVPQETSYATSSFEEEPSNMQWSQNPFTNFSHDQILQMSPLRAENQQLVKLETDLPLLEPETDRETCMSTNASAQDLPFSPTPPLMLSLPDLLLDGYDQISGLSNDCFYNDCQQPSERLSSGCGDQLRIKGEEASSDRIFFDDLPADMFDYLDMQPNL